MKLILSICHAKRAVFCAKPMLVFTFFSIVCCLTKQYYKIIVQLKCTIFIENVKDFYHCTPYTFISTQFYKASHLVLNCDKTFYQNLLYFLSSLLISHPYLYYIIILYLYLYFTTEVQRLLKETMLRFQQKYCTSVLRSPES